MSTLKVNTISHNTPGQTIAVSDSLLVDQLKVGNSTSSAFVSPYNLKNKIINGDMNVGQRGDSWPSAPNNTWALDRWLYTKASTTGVATVSRADITGYPITNNLQLTRSLKVQVTTADATVAADSFHTLEQPVEGFFARDLIDRTFTVSFWVRSTKTGIFSVSITNPGTSVNLRSYIYDYTISSANTWEYKSFTVENGLPSSGTWDTALERSLTLMFPLVVGSNYKTATVGSWVSAQDFASTAMTNNLFDTNGATFEITGIQLELGNDPTQFEILPPNIVFNLCDRYCQRVNLVASIYYTTSGTFSWGYPFRSEMRATPTYYETSQTVPASISNINLVPTTSYGGTVSLTLASSTAGGASAIGYIEAELI